MRFAVSAGDSAAWIIGGHDLLTLDQGLQVVMSLPKLTQYKISIVPKVTTRNSDLTDWSSTVRQRLRVCK